MCECVSVFVCVLVCVSVFVCVCCMRVCAVYESVCVIKVLLKVLLSLFTY